MVVLGSLEHWHLGRIRTNKLEQALGRIIAQASINLYRHTVASRDWIGQPSVTVIRPITLCLFSNLQRRVRRQAIRLSPISLDVGILLLHLFVFKTAAIERVKRNSHVIGVVSGHDYHRTCLAGENDSVRANKFVLVLKLAPTLVCFLGVDAAKNCTYLELGFVINLLAGLPPLV